MQTCAAELMILSTVLHSQFKRNRKPLRLSRLRVQVQLPRPQRHADRRPYEYVPNSKLPRIKFCSVLLYDRSREPAVLIRFCNLFSWWLITNYVCANKISPTRKCLILSIGRHETSRSTKLSIIRLCRFRNSETKIHPNGTV
jgi:hypothetical protein